MAIFLIGSLSGLLFFAVLFFGGAHLWVQSALVLAVWGVALIVFARAGFQQFRRPGALMEIRVDVLTGAGIAFLLWSLLALVPLPPGLLKWLSPQAFGHWQALADLGGRGVFSLSLYPFVTLRSILFLLALLLFYRLALDGLPDRRNVVSLTVVLLLMGVGESLYGLIQLVSGDPHILWWRQAYSREVASGTFIDRNHLAGFLSMLICLALGYFWGLSGKGDKEGRPSRRRRLKRWGKTLGVRGTLVLLAVVLMTAALLASASRMGAFSLLAGLIFMAGLLVIRQVKSGKALFLGLVVLTSLFFTGAVALDRLLARLVFWQGDLADRLALTRAAGRLGMDFPLTGTGLGTFEFVFPAYQDVHPQGLVEFAHNDWAQLLAETGGVGVLLVAVVFFYFLLRSAGRWRRRPEPLAAGISLGGMGALVAIGLHSFTEFNLHLPANALLLALLLAMIQTLLPRESGVQRLPLPRWALTGLLALSMVGAGGAGWWIIRDWWSDSLVRTVRNSTLKEKAADLPSLRKAAELAPGKAPYWAGLAQIEVQAGNPEKAGHFFLRGLRGNPTAWWIWRDLGQTAFRQSLAGSSRQRETARRALDRARQLRPFVSSGHLEYGLFLLATAGDLPPTSSEGREWGKWREPLARALLLDPGLASRIADQLVFYLGEAGAGELAQILPADGLAWWQAGQALLDLGHPVLGLKLLQKGEALRHPEADRLWEELNRKEKAGPELRGQILEKIFRLDPEHPGGLLAGGLLAKALRSQDRRSRPFSRLDSPGNLSWMVQAAEKEKTILPWEAAYWQGRVAEEEGNWSRAGGYYRQAWKLSPHAFPVLDRLRRVLSSGPADPAREGERMRIEREISFYSMKHLPGDSWKETEAFMGGPSWSAWLRIDRPVRYLGLAFKADLEGGWVLLRDGFLVTAWGGQAFQGTIAHSVPAGEHRLQVVRRGKSSLKPEQPPFDLRIELD